MSSLNEINERFPIRKSEEQKEQFRQWVLGEMKARGWNARVERNGKARGKGDHHNVVAGSPEEAEVIITAHYDTPATIGVANVMVPRNLFAFLMRQVLVVGGMLALALGIGAILGVLANNYNVFVLGYIVVYGLELWLLMSGVPNKHNVNDNTSGVAAVLETMAAIPAKDREKVAFILFDNEEKGTKGSKAYAADHLRIQHTKLVINLDCVGVGDTFIAAVPRVAEQLPACEAFKASLTDRDGRKALFFDRASVRGSSDHKRFTCGIGVAAYTKKKGIGYMTGRIHTKRDTYADEGNIAYLSDALVRMAALLEKPAEE